MNLINYYKGQYIICLQKDLLDKHQKVRYSFKTPETQAGN